MPVYAKESLEALKNKIDIVQVIEPHVELKKAGVAYKGLCPFHDEKTPSFTIQKGDAHYHCFGCGAHGDAIAFLMNHQGLGFTEAIEILADKFQVRMETVESDEPKGPPKQLLYQALEEASLFFHTLLLHTEEGHEALHYLYNRGLSLEFIRRFQIGLSPKRGGLLSKFLKEKGVSYDTMVDAALLKRGEDGRPRDFFHSRIMFPIQNHMGRVIGFSGRVYKADTFGGKYVNSSETAVFKKSRVLFGLNFSRKRIAKEKRALIVEGQIDALRLIEAGLEIAVASQGTAFGEGHVKELQNLGVTSVYLSFDSDEAGIEAAAKVGNLFQKIGVEVYVLRLPVGADPDSFVRSKGIGPFIELLEKASDYLTFLVQCRSRKVNLNSPAGKSELVHAIAQQVRGWDSAVMVHESLKKLAAILHVPEEQILSGGIAMPHVYTKAAAAAGVEAIDPTLILESDFLRWLLLRGSHQPDLIQLAMGNLTPGDLKHPGCRQIYALYLDSIEEGKPCDWMHVASRLEPQSQHLLADLHKKKVNPDRALAQMTETVQKILDRNWLADRERIRQKIQNSECSEEEVQVLLKEFDALKQNPPRVANSS